MSSKKLQYVLPNASARPHFLKTSGRINIPKIPPGYFYATTIWEIHIYTSVCLLLQLANELSLYFMHQKYTAGQ